jgi:hypothetical protein
MLAVRINLDHTVVALTLGVKECGAHCAADPNIEGQAGDRGSGCLGDLGGSVSRAIIDNQNVYIGSVSLDFLDNAANG